MNFYAVGGNSQVTWMFRKRGWDEVIDISDADVVVFTGGEDVHPQLYDHDVHPRSFTNILRDLAEREEFKEAQLFKKVCVGVCRGGQFLNVMSGGVMYQHVSCHTVSHNIYCSQTGKTIPATSTHHQMMCPYHDGEVIATGPGCDTAIIYDKASNSFTTTSINVGVEVVWYSRTKSLCFQPHPEYPHSSPELVNYFFSLVDKYVGS